MKEDDLFLWKFGQMSRSRAYSAAAKGKGTGVSWAFGDLVSATVESAAPTDVVLTFPAANAALDETSFTIAGFTVSSASWTNAVMTLVLSSPVLVFHGDLTLTYVSTSETATITNNTADDGHTVAWYDYTDATTLTDDGGGLISSWRDKLASGHNLLGTGNQRPTLGATGIVFNGSNNNLQTATFTYNQPHQWYLVFRQITWSDSDYIIDGINANTCFAQITSTPGVCLYANSNITPWTNAITLNQFFIVRILFSGASSYITVANNAPITGNPGAQHMDGITLGSAQSRGASWANAEFKEAIFRDAADAAPTQAVIYNYLASKYGFATI